MPNVNNYKEQGGGVTVVGGELKLDGGELSVVGGKITKDGAQAAHIADLTDSASGTEIATAVNAILKALEDVGIVASS